MAGDEYEGSLWHFPFFDPDSRLKGLRIVDLDFDIGTDF
jgi:hypothetical protein